MRAVPTLTTQRFIMRQLERADAAALFPTLSDHRQCLYLSRPAFQDEAELWQWLSEPGWNGRTWIAVCQNDNVVGRFVAVPANEEGGEEIGYITCIHSQGQGVARECTQKLIDQLWNEGVRKITAEVDTRNTPSISLLERLDFMREAHLREYEETHAGLCDVYFYQLFRPELTTDP